MGTSDPVVIQNKFYRSLAHGGVFYIAVCWTMLHVMSLLITIVFSFVFIYDPECVLAKNYPPLATILTGISVTLITFIIAFIKRRGARCPLCKGTPLLNTGARAHANSISIPPFNHGYTAVMSIVVRQKFCCMYCGAKFDLLKSSGSKRRRIDAEVEEHASNR